MVSHLPKIPGNMKSFTLSDFWDLSNLAQRYKHRQIKLGFGTSEVPYQHESFPVWSVHSSMAAHPMEKLTMSSCADRHVPKICTNMDDKWMTAYDGYGSWKLVSRVGYKWSRQVGILGWYGWNRLHFSCFSRSAEATGRTGPGRRQPRSLLTVASVMSLAHLQNMGAIHVFQMWIYKWN